MRQLDGALILVVGARRSGTHWLQRILSTHPKVAAIPGETYLFSRGVAPLLDRIQYASRGSTTVGRIYAERETLLERVRELCDEILEPYLSTDLDGATRLLERTPEHVSHIEMIDELYPGTRFVHIIRDGRAVVRSLLAQDWGPSSASEAAEEWRDSVRAGRGQGSRVDHYLEVRYEELRSDTEEVVRRLFADLELRIGDRELEAAVREASVRGNAPRRWSGGGFGSVALQEVERVAGTDLAELGYTSAHRGWRRDTPSERYVEPHWASRSVQDGSLAVDQVIQYLRLPHTVRDATDLFDPEVVLEMIGGAEHLEFRGVAELDRFREAVSGDVRPEWRQVRSTVHASPTLFTVVSTYHGPDRASHDRVFVVRIGDRGVSEVVCYVLRLAPG